MRNPLISLVGQKFNRLTVLSRAENDPNNQTRWNCLCNCGKTTIVRSAALKKGTTKSCGCFSKEIHSKIASRDNFKHGLLKHPLYGIWKAMRDRCNNPHHARYWDYGGRGISVCKRWDDFTLFIQDMGERPVGLTLERKNNNGDYEPDNCVWATYSQQAFNKKR